MNVVPLREIECDDPVAHYDADEAAALLRLPNRAIEACVPAAFHHTDYPTRVTHKSALWRYADTMHDRRARKIFDKLGGLTVLELSLLAAITSRVSAVTASFGHTIIPINAPLAGLFAYRMVKSYYASGTVFEIGPGSGYLGAFLLRDGFDYRSTDITQAFHLWQNEFFGTPQMPWWEWIDHKRPDFPVDVMVCNHALNEMRESALRYLIVRAERMLTENGVLLLDDLGAGYLRHEQQTADIFNSRGWNIAHIGAKSYAFVPPGRKPPVLRPLEEKTRTWADLEKLWADLGATPNPDDEFADFIEGR